MDLESIKRHYAKMSDLELERIAKYEIAALRSEVRPIVESELKKRGYDDFLKAVQVQKKQLSKEKLRDYKAKIKSLDCPSCGSSDADLMAGCKREVRSYLFFMNYRVTRVIACPVCVRAELKKARIGNIIWG